MTSQPITREDIRRAAEFLFDESEFDLWFSSPQSLLGGHIPEEMVARGCGHDVIRLFRQIEEGAFP